MGEALNRGSAEHALCEACPFARDGRPNHPVFAEYPDDPMWFIIGEGPGFNEVRLGRPFVGATGQVVNRILAKIGRPREHVYVTNSTLCQPPQGSPVEEREIAAQCCKPRLQAELAEFPGKPVLTLGAVAARALIPKEILDAIDPPDVPKSKKRAAKDKQQAQHKESKKRRKKIESLARKRFAVMLKYRRDQIRHEAIRANGKKPTRDYLDREVQRGRTVMWQKAWKDGIAEFEQKAKEAELRRLHGLPDPDAKPAKPKKRKPIKITDIVGTLFDIDVDGTGERPVIPAIHPAALLRGGGASIGGSHTPDMAFVNIIYDAAKVDALAKGKDVRLKINVEIEVEDRERATRLFLNALQDAFSEGSFTIDLETYVDNPDKHHALMAYVAKIRVIGIATKHRSISVMWDLLEPAAISYLQLALAKLVTAYHNGLYDRTVFRAHGLIMPCLGVDEDVPEWHDTLLGHHAAFPGNSHRLQTVTAQFFGVRPWKSEFRNAEETPDKLATYNALDTGGTHALVPVIAIHVKKTQTERIYARDRRMSDIASRMHVAGMPVDREVNAQLVGTFTRLAYEAHRVVVDKANDPKIQDAIKHHLAIQLAAKKRKADSDEFEDRYNIRLADLRAKDWRWNANNSKHIAALLQAMGVSLFQTTEGGAISTKKDILESLVEVAVVRDILKARENFKMLDFTAYMFDQCDGDGHVTRYGFCDEEDRCHPIWSIHKISGRWAGSEPHGVSNPPREKTRKVLVGSELLRHDSIILEVYCKHCKQQQHDRTDHVFEVGEVLYAERPTTKRQFKAKNGRVIVGFDFAQIEARIIALISGDPFMCEVFNRVGGDLHTECAIDVFPGFKDRPAPERKMMRTVCKTLEYATWYGANDEKVWKGLLKEGYNFKLADVSKSLGILRKKMSGVIRWQRETIHRASQPPYTLRDFVSGRMRVWPMGNVEASEALNCVPQFTGAAIMNMGMEKMDMRLPKYKQAFCISQVHDAAYFECWEDDADKIETDIDECFSYEHEREDGLRMKFTVDIGTGTSLADC